MIQELLAAIPFSWLRRCLGWLWSASWCVLLYAGARPWKELGGVVDERLRWAAWAALLWGIASGFAVGRLGRRASLERGRVTHARLVRSVVVPVALLVAIAAIPLSRYGSGDVAGATILGLLAFWAGIDLAYAAVPLMDGLPYAFRSPLAIHERTSVDSDRADRAGPLL